MTLPHQPVVAPTTGQAASGQTRAEGAGLAAPPAQPPDVELPDQIVQSLRLQATAGGGEARMHLRPEYLGELTVRVVVDNGVVTARLEAEVPAVREWIERHEVSLRQALGAHGLTLEELIVSDKAAGDQSRDQDHKRQSNHQDPDQPSPRGRRRRPDEASPRFEVVA